MTTEDVSDFLTRVLKEQDFDFYNPDEVIYWYCYSTQQGYHKAEELKKKYEVVETIREIDDLIKIINGLVVELNKSPYELFESELVQVGTDKNALK